MRKGVVVESGSHDELMQNADGAYARLARRQMTSKSRASLASNPSAGSLLDMSVQG